MSKERLAMLPKPLQKELDKLVEDGVDEESVKLAKTMLLQGLKDKESTDTEPLIEGGFSANTLVYAEGRHACVRAISDEGIKRFNAFIDLNMDNKSNRSQDIFWDPVGECWKARKTFLSKLKEAGFHLKCVSQADFIHYRYETFFTEE